MSKETLSLVTFEPGICKEREKEDGTKVPPRYKGTVTIRMPDFDERLDLFEELGSATAGSPQGDSVEERTERGAKLIRESARRAARFVVAVDLERLEDGFKITTWDQVRAETATHGLVSEVGARVIGRYELGKT